MKILLTGSSGFIGKHILAELLVQQRSVQMIPDPFRNVLFLDPGPFVLIHQAANTDPQDKDRDGMLRVNWSDAIKLFELAIEAGCKKIVYASSAAVYGKGERVQTETDPMRPLTPYAESKALLDVSAGVLSRRTGVPIVGLRYSNVFGPGENHKGKSASVVFQLVQQMKAGQRPKLFEHGEQRRDWVSVHDVVQANLLALECDQSGVFNVGSGRALTFNSVVKTINRVVYENKLLADLIIDPELELKPEYIPNPYAGTYQDLTQLNLTKSETFLKYEPKIDLKGGIRELLRD